MTSFSQHIVDESDKETNIKTEILRKLQLKEKKKKQGNGKKYLDRLQQERGLIEPTQMKHINFWHEMKAKWEE